MRRYRVLIWAICLVAVLLLLGLLSKNSLIIIIAQALIAAISIFLAVWGIKQLAKGIKSTLISKPEKGRFWARARLPILVLAVFGVSTLLGFQIGTVRWLTASETLGVNCGDIGVKGYQPTSLPVAAPDIILEQGTVITVTTGSDVSDGGNDSSLPALLAHPGSDGISLREALEVTNQAPGVYTICFADHLVDATINLENPLPLLRSGNVIINGDITDDGRPDIIIDGAGFDYAGFVVSSSGNTLHALTIQNCNEGVQFNPLSSTNTTFADNVVSNLQMRDIDEEGINLSRGWEESPMTGNQWVNTLIIGNEIEAVGSGIAFGLGYSAGNRIEKTRIINNTIRTEGADYGVGIHLQAGLWVDSVDNKIVDALIANNTIEIGGSDDSFCIRVAAGDSAGRNIVDGIRIVGNRIRMTRPGDSFPVRAGISLIAGDSATTAIDPTYRPIYYPEDNIIRNVWIEDNIIEGRGWKGIDIFSGYGGARYNTVEDVFVLGNLIDIGLSDIPPFGIVISGGPSPISGPNPDTSPNEVSDINIQWNTIRLSKPGGFLVYPDGVWGGVIIHHAVNNAATGLQVSHNDIAGGSIIDIGAKGVPRMAQFPWFTFVMGTNLLLDTGSSIPDGIEDIDLEVECNRVVGPSTLIINLQYLAIIVAAAGLLARRLGKA